MAGRDDAAPAVAAGRVGRRERLALTVRAARPADVPALLRMKRQLAILEQAEFALRATPDDWLRDGFGVNARFAACIAERGAAVAGMATFSLRYYTGWAGSSLFVEDLYVDPDHRRRGVAGALLAHLAAVAIERECPFIELTVREENLARELYRRCGFVPVQDCAVYVLGGPALAGLAARSDEAAAGR